MPYSTRYIMSQLARGRPMPKGRPEDDLFRALESLSSSEVSRAIHMGASPSSLNGQGHTTFEVLAGVARRRSGAHGLTRAVLCLEELNRAGRPTLGQTPHGVRALIQAGEALALDRREQIRWFQGWKKAVSDPRVWSTPDSRGNTPLGAWKANAGPALMPSLERLSPPTRAPAGPRP